MPVTSLELKKPVEKLPGKWIREAIEHHSSLASINCKKGTMNQTAPNQSTPQSAPQQDRESRARTSPSYIDELTAAVAPEIPTAAIGRLHTSRADSDCPR
jgi:hypothetical protein